MILKEELLLLERMEYEKNWLRLIWNFLEEPTSLITLSESLPTFMKSSITFGNMAL